MSAGDYESLLAATDEQVHHSFAGRHALSGERHTREGMRLWFERLFRLFPSLRFEVRDVVSRGWPWDTHVAIEWSVAVTPAAGAPYTNTGAHLIRLRWGRATQIRAYEDSQRVVEALAVLAEAGIEEAAALPIET